jgi:outer membrane receptor for monomeric catechols
MKLLNIERQHVEAAQSQTLDQLWHEAEQLGTIEVDRMWSQKGYTVSIRFTRKTGTTIIAKGQNTNIAFALADAINEAREMGAGAAQ